MKISHPVGVILILGIFLTALRLSPPLRADVQDSTLRIPLPQLTLLDSPLDHLELFEALPPRVVTLPAVDTSGARFLTVFYSWHQTNTPDLVIMVVDSAGGELLYIDRNYDDDLSNDGDPDFYPAESSEHILEIVAREDPHQRTRLLLARTPRQGALPDSLLEQAVDSDGNLNPSFARVVGALKGKSDFEGRRGTFYWDGRVSLRRGMASVRQREVPIGLFDFGNNGRFNDSDDVILIDREGSGRLTYFDDTQIVYLREVFTMGGETWRVRDLDPYGRWLELERTDEPVNPALLTRRDSLAALQALSGTEAFQVDSSLWSIEGETLEADSFSLSEYRGFWLLLSFWGEWCAPCLQEIPTLRNAVRTYSELQIVGFLRTEHLPKAQELIASEEMTWPQVRLTPELEKQFRIVGYPTNILLSPDGLRGIRLPAVTDAIFEQLLKR